MLSTRSRSVNRNLLKLCLSFKEKSFSSTWFRMIKAGRRPVLIMVVELKDFSLKDKQSFKRLRLTDLDLVDKHDWSIQNDSSA